MTASSGTRPRAERLPRSERRAQLVDVASDVFVEFGYHAAAMDQIAERAGVSKPVLYQHFPGKLELYTAIVSEACEEVVASLETAMASSTVHRDRVAATIGVWYDFVAEGGKSYRLVFESDLTNDPHVRTLLDKFNFDAATVIAERVTEDTNIPLDAALVIAGSLVGASQVGARTWMSSDSSLSRAEAVALSSSLLWRGLSGLPVAVSPNTAD
ncbi:MAG: TetR/AcrR family transcriptional regulator [Aeromicrobium sp.]|nr:MAG: TetR/AcrR family transcriptional regulator [Aeromicrobium sp.]